VHIRRLRTEIEPDTAALHRGATRFSVYLTSSAERIRHQFDNVGNRVDVCEPALIHGVRAVAG
jgi:hypothetical protein